MSEGLVYGLQPGKIHDDTRGFDRPDCRFDTSGARLTALYLELASRCRGATDRRMMSRVTGERLTRQELGWLLAQEARSAAKALRDGITRLEPSSAEPPPFVLTLDALDGAIDQLTELEFSPRPRGRRGRIDLASLAYELAPGARIVMEPGAGTEVFGDEEELRRMVHVLVRQSPGAPDDANPPEVHIRRQEDFVKITVPLGPDRSATTELERRWLSRMALQLGGRLELEGGVESVLLPADGAAEHREVQELRKELAQAEQLGAAYARELAWVVSQGAEPEGPPSSRAEVTAPDQFDLLVSTAGALVRTLRPTVEALRGDTENGARWAGIFELYGELNRIADCPRDEPAVEIDVHAMLAEVVDLAGSRMRSHTVRLTLAPAGRMVARTGRATLALLLGSLLDQAIMATPRDGEVVLSLELTDRGGAVVVADGGPTVPAAAQFDLLSHRVDPTAFGRPPGLALLVANTLAARLGGTLNLRQGLQGGNEIELVLPSLGAGADLG